MSEWFKGALWGWWACMLVCAFGWYAGPATAAPAPAPARWEYNWLSNLSTAADFRLLGEQGWEMCAATNGLVYFKRRVP